MNSDHPLLECVPNFSEGRDEKKIQAIADAIRDVDGAHLLHIDVSPAANRTVMTFAGSPDAVIEAAYQAIKTAAGVIDMRAQDGVHPRIGATDVCPLVPLAGLSMEQAVQLSKELGYRVGNELKIPVYLYENSAGQAHRQTLPDIRKGQYEGFAEKITLPAWAPDYGPSKWDSQTGATVIGARDILVAFNISLDTNDVIKADDIARRIRTKGYTIMEAGTKRNIPGLLPRLRAIGWYMADYNCAQVSMNLLDYRITTLLQVWEACGTLAAQEGIVLTGSEVIGLLPESCLLEAGVRDYMKQGLPVPAGNELLVHNAIDLLGLNKVKPFDPQEKVLEYALHNAGLI